MHADIARDRARLNADIRCGREAAAARDAADLARDQRALEAQLRDIRHDQRDIDRDEQRVSTLGVKPRGDRSLQGRGGRFPVSHRAALQRPRPADRLPRSRPISVSTLVSGTFLRLAGETGCGWSTGHFLITPTSELPRRSATRLALTFPRLGSSDQRL